MRSPKILAQQHKVLERIFVEHNHDLESLAPQFQAERFLELLEQAGWTINNVTKLQHYTDNLSKALQHIIDSGDTQNEKARKIARDTLKEIKHADQIDPA